MTDRSPQSSFDAPTLRSGRRLLRTLGLTLVVAAGASCQPDATLRPDAEPRAHRSVPRRAGPPAVQLVRVRSLEDGHAIPGSGAVLFRHRTGLEVRLWTRELEPGERVEVFWAVFNNPAACAHPNALTGAPCSPPDLFVPEAQGSLHLVATLSAREGGRLFHHAWLAVGSDEGCVGPPFPCGTLTDPFGAEVHVPLFVPGGGPGVQAAQFLPASR